MSVELSYLRRWLLNFVVTDNLAIAAGNFDKFTITAPVDARLPDGGGYAVPGPLYNVNPSKASVAANNFVTLDTNYGGQSQTSNAIALNLNARPRNGLVIQGGFNTEQHVVRLLLDPCGDARAHHRHRPADAARPIRTAVTARAG